MLIRNWWCFVAVMAIFGIAISDDDREMQQAMYCEQVKTFKETGGTYGWPDYNENAEVVCGR